MFVLVTPGINVHVQAWSWGRILQEDLCKEDFDSIEALCSERFTWACQVEDWKLSSVFAVFTNIIMWHCKFFLLFPSALNIPEANI